MLKNQNMLQNHIQFILLYKHDITYESIEKEAIKKTSLEDVTIAPTPTNVTPKEEKATSYKVTWTSDDDKKIEATVKKNKDVKIDEVN